MPDNQMTEEKLRDLTNEEFGYETTPPPSGDPTQKPLEEGQPAPKVIEPAPLKEGETPEGETAPAIPEGGQAITDEVLKSLEETPYKTIPDIVKGYKELRSRDTKSTEKLKGYEQYDPFFDKLKSDPTFAKVITDAVQAYYSGQPFVTPQGNVVQEPNLNSYDLYTPEGIAQYQQDLRAFMERTVDQKLTQRLTGIEQQAQLERLKMQFQAKHPDMNVDEIIQYTQTREPLTLEDFYRLKEYDNLESRSLERARKEITKQIEEAGKNKTPAGSTSTQTAKVEDIISHIIKYGQKAAVDRFGKAKVHEAEEWSAVNY